MEYALEPLQRFLDLELGAYGLEGPHITRVSYAGRVREPHVKFHTDTLKTL